MKITDLKQGNILFNQELMDIPSDAVDKVV